MEIMKGRMKQPQRVVLYGPEGIGKTTLAAKWPHPLFIDCEGGTWHLPIDRTPQPESWSELLEFVDEAPRLGYRTLVVDTADAAESLCIAHVCEEKGKTGIEDFGYGKGYTYLAEEFSKLLTALDKCLVCNMNVVFTAHAQIRKFELPDEMGAYDRWELKLQKKTAPLLKEWADALVFLNFETIVEKVGADKNGQGGTNKARGSKRVMYLEHHACWDAKNRWGLGGKLALSFDPMAPHIYGVETDEPVQETPAPVPEAEQPEKTVTPEHMDELLTLLGQNGYNIAMFRHACVDRKFQPADLPVERYPDEFICEMGIKQFSKLKKILDKFPRDAYEDEATPF